MSEEKHSPSSCSLFALDRALREKKFHGIIEVSYQGGHPRFVKIHPTFQLGISNFSEGIITVEESGYKHGK